MNKLTGCVLLAVTCVLAAACAPQSVPAETIAGSYSATLTEQALSDAGAPRAIAISFTDAEFTLGLTADGAYTFFEITGIGPRERSSGKFNLTPDRLVLLKDTGDISCSAVGVERGTYTWALSGDQLRFSLIEDACQDRIYIMTAAPWTRAP